MRFFLLLICFCWLIIACDKKNTSGNHKPYEWQQPRIAPNALTKFISSPEIDPKVEELANLGFQRYTNNINNIMSDRNAARPANGEAEKKKRG